MLEAFAGAPKIDRNRLQADLDRLVDQNPRPRELAAGTHATDDPIERAHRQDRLQRVEALFDARPFDAAAARAYGRAFAAVVAGGRKARGRRVLDLLIAATALASDLPLYTRNPDDFTGLEGLVEIVAIPA